MSFIGVIVESKQENFIYHILTKNLDKTNTIICINEKSIENMKNIKFETILIACDDNRILKKEELKIILSNTKYLVINSDLKTNLEMLNNLNLNVITYGFNSKATITASSVTEENILLCIQRNVETIQGEVLEAQEINIHFFDKNTVNHVMGIVSVLLIYGKKEVKI